MTLNELLPLFDRIADPESNVLHLLSLPGFDAAARLAPLDRLLQELSLLCREGGPDHFLLLDPVNLAVVAQRLLLGRDASGLSNLAALWRAHRTPEKAVQIAVEAARTALERWSGLPDVYSSAHAEFVKALGEIERADQDGPLGRAVGLSRYQGAGNCDRPWPRLAGETRHTGFPVVFDGFEKKTSAFAGAAWVWPEEGVGELCVPGAPRTTRPRQRGPRRRNPFDQARDAWRQLCQSLPGADEQVAPPNLSLPEWFLLAAARSTSTSLRSASLAIGLDRLARLQGRPLPAGVGFTADLEPAGRLEDARLRPVSGIPDKLRAAREAGLFVLFACYDHAGEPVPDEPGITLVRLPEVTLGDAVCLINTACANLGVTEYRWQWADKQLRTGLSLPPTERAIGSQALPDAAEEHDGDEPLPVGFVGRQRELNELDSWWDQARGKRRRRGVLIGDPRAGKTTLLGRWLRPSERCPRLPVWFSFLRGRQGALTAADMEAALTEQVLARFCVLLRPSAALPGPGRDDLWRFLEDHVRADVAVILDGLDEIPPGERRQAVARLETLGGNGLLVLGSQQVAELPGPGWSVLSLRTDSEQGLIDAAELVRRFAERFRQRELETEANLLALASWQQGLARQAGGNLWMLTDFLLHVERNGAGLPQDPSGTILSSDVEEYCKRLLHEVVRSCPVSSEGTELGRFLVGLAILEDRCWPAFPPKDRWPLNGVLQLLGLDGDAARWERLLSEHASHLIAQRHQRIRFRTVTVRQALKRAHPGSQQSLAERLVKLVRTGPAGPGDLFSQRYAISSVARHLAGEVDLGAEEAAALAAELLFETPWASKRLRSVAAAGQPVNEMLRELAELRPLVEQGVRAGLAPVDADAALESLQGALAVWGQAIEQSRGCARWWNALVALRPFPCWTRQAPPDTPEVPVLLLPEDGPSGPGYAVPGTPALIGPACELLSATSMPGLLVCAAEHGFLVVYGYNPVTRGFDFQDLVGLGVKDVRALVSLDDNVVAVLAQDWAQAPRLLQVDVCSKVVTELENPTGGTPVAIAPLAAAAPDQPRRLLVAAWTTSHTRVAILEDGHDSGIPHAELPFRANGLLTFAPTAWAVHHVHSGRALRQSKAITEKPDQTEEDQSEEEVDERAEDDRDEGPRDWDQFVVQRLVGRTIITVELRTAKTLRHLWIGGLSQGPEQQLFVQAFTEDATVGFLYTPDGTIAKRTSIWSEPDGASSDPFPDYGAMCPLVWNDQLGLLITNDVQGIIALPLGHEALPRYLPEDLEKQVPGADGSGELPLGGLRLSDGRSLLVYDFGGVILGPDCRSVVYVGEPTAPQERPQPPQRIVGIREDGTLLLGKREWHHFLPFDSDQSDIPDIEMPSDLDDLLPESETKPPLAIPVPPPDGPGLGDAGGHVSGAIPEESFFLTASDRRRYRMADSRVYRVDSDGGALVCDLSTLKLHEVTGHPGGQFHLIDVADQVENRWRLRVAFGNREEAQNVLRVCTADLEADTNRSSLVGEPVRINLGPGDVTCCTPVGPDCFALGFESGRIEIISLTPDKEGNKEVLALGFTLSAPTDMKLPCAARKAYLAVVSGKVVWFDLSDLLAADGTPLALTHRA